MKSTIIPIGNSKGIRIPKPFLEHCHIGKEVFLETEGDKLIIKPIIKKARENWEQSFIEMGKNRDDKLIISDNIDLDIQGWEW